MWTLLLLLDRFHYFRRFPWNILQIHDCRHSGRFFVNNEEENKNSWQHAIWGTNLLVSHLRGTAECFFTVRSYEERNQRARKSNAIHHKRQRPNWFHTFATCWRRWTEIHIGIHTVEENKENENCGLEDAVGSEPTDTVRKRTLLILLTQSLI